ncbi:hypothetical protein B0H12DRAFT_1242925 [Mycena haematopus]|nr:hypothetical protein B0H12DRAFT_1242925 [Mycena haematopus]
MENENANLFQNRPAHLATTTADYLDALYAQYDAEQAEREQQLIAKERRKTRRRRATVKTKAEGHESAKDLVEEKSLDSSRKPNVRLRSRKSIAAHTNDIVDGSVTQAAAHSHDHLQGTGGTAAQILRSHYRPEPKMSLSIPTVSEHSSSTFEVDKFLADGSHPHVHPRPNACRPFDATAFDLADADIKALRRLNCTQLRALCFKHGVGTTRSKNGMIENLSNYQRQCHLDYSAHPPLRSTQYPAYYQPMYSASSPFCPTQYPAYYQPMYSAPSSFCYSPPI